MKKFINPACCLVLLSIVTKAQTAVAQARIGNSKPGESMSDDLDILSILIGLVIGILIGYFIWGRKKAN